MRFLQLPELPNPDAARIRFVYAASDPGNVTRTETGHDSVKYAYSPAPVGRIRIWKTDGNETRNSASLSEGGDYVRPREEYGIADLGSQVSERTWKFFIEAVRAGDAVAGDEIRIEINPDGNGYTGADSVRLTAVGVQVRNHGTV